MEGAARPNLTWLRVLFVGFGLFGFGCSRWILFLASEAQWISRYERSILQFIAILFGPVSAAFLLSSSAYVRKRWPWISWLMVGLAGLALSSFFLGAVVSAGSFFSWEGLIVVAFFGVFLYILLQQVVVELLQEEQFRSYPEGFIPPRLPTLRILRGKRLVRFDEIAEAHQITRDGPVRVFLRLRDGAVIYLLEESGIPVAFLADLVGRTRERPSAVH